MKKLYEIKDLIELVQSDSLIFEEYRIKVRMTDGEFEGIEVDLNGN